MARTLIGQLLIRLSQQGAKQAANEVSHELGRIESAAKRLAKAPWGAGFQAQLDKFKLTPQQAQQVINSWNQLPRDINGRLKKADLTGWRTAVLREFSATESKARAHVLSMNRILGSVGKIALVTGGAYTGAYLGGVMVRGGVDAASEQAHQEANAKFAGLPEEDRARIKAEAEKKAAQYRIFTADFFQVLKEASLSMPSTDAALEVSDTMARAYVVLQSMFGKDGAINGLYALNKALDNINLNQNPEDYKKAVGLYLQAQQVLGADLSPQAMAQAIKYSRTAGKVFSPDFLFTWLAAVAAETGGSDAGNQLRANFDQLIGGRASKKAEKALAAYGLRTPGEGLVQQDLYSENPIVWANEVLLPALKKGGVNTESEVEIAKALSEITNNRLSADLMARSIFSFQQYLRYAQTTMPRAMGLDAADEVQALDPFAAGNALLDSMRNLSAAIGEHVLPTIVPGLNALADGINSLAGMVRELPNGWSLGGGIAGLGLLGFGAYKGGKGLLGILSSGFGLQTSAVSLQTAAVMLQEAAVAQGATGAAGGAAGAAKNAPWWAAPLGFLKGVGILAAPGVLESLTTGSPSSVEEYNAQVQEQAAIKKQMWSVIDGVFGGGPQSNTFTGGLGDTAYSIFSGGAPRQTYAAQEGIKAAADELASTLDIKAKPEVDTSSIDAATQKARELAAALKEVGNWAARSVQSVDQAVANTYTDYGVVP